MRKCTLLLIAAVLSTFAACGGKEKAKEEKNEKSIGLSTKNEGDSTLYGLACDGCTDSVIVFLPGTGGDPVTYDIIEAWKQHRVLGRPRVGDWICLMVNKEDSTKADLVIDLDELKGTWVNMELPHLRQNIDFDTIPGFDEKHKARIDSILEAEMKPVEMGFALKRSYVAQAVGRQYGRDNEDSPIVYPTPKRYTEWHIVNGKLVLTETAATNTNQQEAQQQPPKQHNDTVDILFLLKDSLRIRYSDGTEKGFYRK